MPDEIYKIGELEMTLIKVFGTGLIGALFGAYLNAYLEVTGGSADPNLFIGLTIAPPLIMVAQDFWRHLLNPPSSKEQ